MSTLAAVTGISQETHTEIERKEEVDPGTLFAVTMATSSRRRREDGARSLVHLFLVTLAVAAVCSSLGPIRARLGPDGLGLADALRPHSHGDLGNGDEDRGPSLAATPGRRMLRGKRHKALLPLDSSDRYGFFFATIGLMVCHFFLPGARVCKHSTAMG